MFFERGNVNITLFKGFAKSCAMCAMHASVVYVPTCQRFNVVKVWRRLIFTCQRANKRTNVQIFQLGVPTFQKEREFFNFICQKAYQFFNYFWIFQLCLTFANLKNIWAVLENLSRETKNLNFQFSKISLRKDLMNLEALMQFLTEHIRLTEQLFG